MDQWIREIPSTHSIPTSGTYDAGLSQPSPPYEAERPEQKERKVQVSSKGKPQCKHCPRAEAQRRRQNRNYTKSPRNPKVVGKPVKQEEKPTMQR